MRNSFSLCFFQLALVEKNIAVNLPIATGDPHTDSVLDSAPLRIEAVDDIAIATVCHGFDIIRFSVTSSR